MQVKNRIIWGLAIVAVLAATSGCASRGYVRNQVGQSADELQARMDENAERLGQDLAGLENETRQAHAEQGSEIARTQEMIQTTQEEMAAEIAEVRDMAENAGTLAGLTEERTRMIERAIADQGRLELAESMEIYFGFGSSSITPEHFETLEAIANTMTREPETILVLEGRTDSTGDPTFNTLLGERRVDAARGYLVIELGVPVHRIHGFSYGEAQPDYDNDEADGRQMNRSVKLLVFGPTTSTAVASLPE